MSVTINLNNVQATLVNETNIKSLNGTTILGSGQITVDKTFVGLSNVANVDQQNAGNITSGTLSGARLPNPQTTVLGGVKRNTGTAGQFVTGISASGDLEYSIPTGGGDVTGAASSVNNNIAVFDGTTGKIIKDGGETIASINSSINGKEPAISAGTTGQYFRGDKTFQNLNATAVGLGNVANVDQQNADNITSGTLSGARLPNPQTTVLGGVKRNTGTAGQFVSGIDASGNLEYSTPTGGGDVTGAASSVNNNIAVFDGTTGKIIKDGGETIASINSSISGKQDILSEGAFVNGDKTKLDGIAAGAQVNTVTSVATKTGAVTLDKNDVGLGNVDNTSDVNKPISSATQTALDAKEGTITAGTTGQYFRGDKTFQTLDKAAVGLGNVANVDQQNADNITSGTLGGARLPAPTTTVLGGVKRNTGSAGQFVSGISNTGDLEYSTPTGGGDVTGAASSVNNNIAVFDGTTGKIIKDGGETIASINSSISGKENTITATTSADYYRGDKTFQPLNATAVGLSNVANVDQQNADNITSGTLGGARLPNPTTTVLGGVKRNTGSAGEFVSGIDASGNLTYSTPTGGGDVTGAASSVNNNIAVFDGTTGKIIKDGGETIASINSSIGAKENAITATTSADYYRGDKTFQPLNATAVGLGNVANVDQQNADNITSGTLSGARLPAPTTTVLGGVKRNTGTAGQFVTGIDAAGELEYSTPSGGGDVVGPGSAVDNRIAVFDGTTGKLIKDGGVTIAEIGGSVDELQIVLLTQVFS